jgi:GNAT superfamily N-acetyltransferase
MNMEIKYYTNALTPESFAQLRDNAGWGNIPFAQAQKAISNTPFSIVALDGTKVIGMGRLVGDGSLIWYIQDLVVLPEYQNRGIGSCIMAKLLDFATNTGLDDTIITIGLMAAKGKEGFYKKFGFHTRPNDLEDAGMILDKKTKES